MEDIMIGSEQEILFYYRFAAAISLFLSATWFGARLWAEINVFSYRIERAMRQSDAEWSHDPWGSSASFALFVISLLVFVKMLFV
jgi:hypothetical protein